MKDRGRRPVRIALLPLYLELYDRTLPELLGRQSAFLSQVVARLQEQGAQVLTLPVCRSRAQVAAALAEAGDVAGLITLHLAYSPSLECAASLIESPLPLLLLDTTPGSKFGAGATVDDMLANHGIHGLQDLASVLRRAGRDYTIAAGPLDSPRLWHRVTAWMRAAQARHLLRRLRVAQIGEAFAGMGDFDVSPEFLREKVGPERVAIEIGRIGELCGQVTPAGLAAEKAADAQAFDTAGCRDECLDRANRVGLALRRALEAEGAEAFSMNFASFDRSRGTPTVPFLEASKALARGIGYAGEGDVLTASLVAALQCYAPTTFTEMFCPDWSGGRIFMSHMGECNPALAKGRPRIVEKDFSFGAADNPAVLVFALRPGPAALVNLAPRRDSLALIAADVEIADAELEPGLPGMPHFWIVPRAGDVAAFLETYSEAGGTHHLALTPGLRASDLRDLARALNWDFVLLD